MQFGIFLKKAMQNGNVTQSELAAKAAVSQGAISRYLNGKASPKAEELLRIADALGVEMAWLLTGRGPAPPRAPAESGKLRDAARSAEALGRKLRDAEAELERLRTFLG